MGKMDIDQVMEDFFDYAVKNPPVYIAFIIVCLGVIAGALLLGSNMTKNSQFRMKNPNGNLTVRQQQAINTGAIMGAMFGDYCNSLQTKRFGRATKIGGWGIDSASSAKETIWGMITGEYGQSLIFDQLKEYVINENDAVFDSDRDKVFFQNLKKSLPLLIKEDIISTPEDVLKISTFAWDMGRLVNISRWSYDLEYITEEEAWEAIYIAYEGVLETYGSWQDFAKGYLLGRAMWGGTSGMHGPSRIIRLKTIIQITERLLKHKDSPWNTVPFK